MIIKITDREIDVASYRPDFINEFEEMQQIARAEDSEFKRLLFDTQYGMDQMYFETATEAGLDMLAKEYGVVFVPGSTLEDKRMAIKLELASRVPYTKVTLKRFIDNLIGAGNYIWNIDFAAQTLWIRIDLGRRNQRSALYKMLRKVLPAVMGIDLDLRYNQVYMLKLFTVEELKQYTVGQLRNDPIIKETYLARGGDLM